MWGFNLLQFDKRIFTPKGIKKWFNACRERLEFGVCSHDAASLRDYLGQVMVLGLSCYALNLHSLPIRWMGNKEGYKQHLLDIAGMIRFAISDHDCPYEVGTSEYKEFIKQDSERKQDCVNQAFESLAEIFMDMWD